MLDSAYTATAAHLDEDHWVVPDEWWARSLPVRGHGPRREPLPVSATAIADQAERLAAHQDSVRDTLGNSHPDPELARAGAAAVADFATCSPLGAAALSLALEIAEYGTPAVADAWVLQHGLVFAAEAAVLHAGLIRDGEWDRSNNTYRYRISRGSSGDPGRSDAPENLRRVRALLADASEQDYRAAVAAIDALRSAPGGLAIRIAASYLLPTEQHWVRADLDELTNHVLDYNSRFLILIGSVHAYADFERLVGAFPASAFIYSSQHGLWETALARFGPECAGAIDRMLRDRELSGDYVAKLAAILARFPTDAAFSALASRIEQRFIPPALLEASLRYPRRALRLLGPIAPKSGMARHILRTLAALRPALGAQLPEGTGFLDTDRLRTAAPAELPEVLRALPWREARAKSKTVSFPELAQSIPHGLAWLPGEQAEWAATEVTVYRPYHTDWAASLARAVVQNHGDLMRMLALAPEELARPYLATTKLDRYYTVEHALRRILARFGMDALPFVLRAVQQDTQGLAYLLAPITGSAVTLTTIRRLDGKNSRPTALAWLDRNHTTALPTIIGTALGKPGKDRRHAENALRLLAERGHRDAVDSAALALGDRVAEAITAVLEANPLHQLPPRIPVTPDWLVPEQLPALALRSDGGSAPRDAATFFSASDALHVCTMLAMSGANGDYAGVAQVVAATDPESLAEFAWGVFEAWRFAGYPSKDSWALHALGLLGNDETARRLGPMIRNWPGQSAHARAVSGLDILTALGTDVALMQLHGIAEKAKFKGLKTKAQEKIAEVAETLELTPEQLADRLVPDFGLDARGTLALDYGPRGFLIGFDEQLKPTVSDAIRDADGSWQATALRKSLPKPGVKDDAEQATAAYKSFGLLKKEVKSAAADQIRRFERAMVLGRRWTAEEHHRLFVAHPLLWHLTRRLVWATFGENDAVTRSFRIAEDRTRADSADDPVTLADETVVGLAHPLHLGDDLGAWGEVFADYEILQPFPQLQRETYAFDADEVDRGTLPRFQDLIIPTGKLLGLSRFGWERGAPADGGVSCEVFRVLGDNRSMVIDMEPGIIAGEAMEFDQQKITVRLATTGHEDYWVRNDSPHVFADLSPITASEVLRELNALVTG
ncbi:DUF4132 domain-containing protein [Nocardia sp. NPDC058058]|uniref:DUF4132 domain-containing protein n=1 Tax=Nocardia sp. NPDC058058 TaxID=3346317 RepID=UPI0036D92B6B